MKMFFILLARAFVFATLLLPGSLRGDRCCPSVETCKYTCDTYYENGNQLPGPTGRPGVSTVPVCAYMNDASCTAELNYICRQLNHEEVCQEKYGTPNTSDNISKDDCCPNAVICKNSCNAYRSNSNSFPGPIPFRSTIPICKYLNNTYCSHRLGYLCSQTNYQQLCEEKYENSSN